jgi:hypothetical protein
MTETDPGKRPSHSILGPLLGLCGTLAILAGIALAGRVGPKPAEPSYVPTRPTEIVAKAPAPAAEPVATPEPTPPPKIEPDRAAIARAEEALDTATRERAESEARLADAGLALRKAALDSARDAAASRILAFQVKDPTARIERATNRVATTRWEIKKIQGELVALEKTPRPKVNALMDKSAVAKPIDGKEYHFEVRRDRVAFLDIDKFTELVKTDVRLRLRMSSGRNRSLSGVVGPVGDFSMRYEMGMTMPESMAEMLDMRGVSLQLHGWELVPENDLRGESYETLASPASSYGRVIRRINPATATITLWIYPDGYPLYRRIRDELHAKGFLVAARPLPDGMSIRGSPGGSLSAGQ